MWPHLDRAILPALIRPDIDLAQSIGISDGREVAELRPGIGLAHVDLDPALTNPAARLSVERAVRATEWLSFGWNRCACHGDAGAWEFLERALDVEAASAGTTPLGPLSIVRSSLDENGPVCGSASDTFQPDLLAGQGGVLYQLLKSHPQSALPSFLTLSSPN